jgi:hypothetical protein
MIPTKSPVQKLTKPSLVDLLRMCDKNRWCCPRIRYASIRSKPDLCTDLLKFFTFEMDGEFIEIRSLRNLVNFPALKYHLKTRRFWRNGEAFDAATVSRERPCFRLEKKTVTLSFGQIRAALGSGTSVAAFLRSQVPG